MTLFGFKFSLSITRQRPEIAPPEIAPLSIEDWLFYNFRAEVHLSTPYSRKPEEQEKIVRVCLSCERHGNTIYSETVAAPTAKEALMKAVLAIEASATDEWRKQLPIDMGFVQIEPEKTA